MNEAILDPEVQQFIKENLSENLSKLILKGSNFPNVSIQEIATQISGFQRAKHKLPTWYATPQIVFPPNINLEQTSSEFTAHYKASLVKGDNLIDITGGFGIDTCFFSKKIKRVIHCELQHELAEIAAHNFRMMNISNITSYVGDGMEYIKTINEHFDWIYMDPARRDDYGGKVFMLEHCAPDVPQNLNLLFGKGKNILIKTSPLLDLKAGMLELKNIAEIHIVSVNNEVKELVWILKKSAKEILIKTINILPKGTQEFEAALSSLNKESPLSLPKEYIYEPNPAIMKSGMFGALAQQTGTTKLHMHSHLYTSDQLTDFPGRRFKLLKILPYKKKVLKKDLDMKKAHITTRNFPKTVLDLRKELKLTDGGLHYLFFTTDMDGNKIVLVCEKAISS